MSKNSLLVLASLITASWLTLPAAARPAATGDGLAFYFVAGWKACLGHRQIISRQPRPLRDGAEKRNPIQNQGETFPWQKASISSQLK